MRKRLECKITGRVQLVMFRDFAQRKAKHLGLVGFVQNQPDGSVVAIAEGEDEILQKWLELLWRGSIASKVKDIHAQWKEPTDEFRYFEIRY